MTTPRVRAGRRPPAVEMPGPAQRRPAFRRRKVCPFCGSDAAKIDSKEVKLLQRFLLERGQIMPSRMRSGDCARLRPTCALIWVAEDANSDRPMERTTNVLRYLMSKRLLLYFEDVRRNGEAT